MRPAPLYSALPPNIKQLLQRSLARGLGEGNGEAKVFFRADDIGVPGHQFERLIQLFVGHGQPLCLAVVPTWLTQNRLATIHTLTGKKNSSQWCWHQHGWLHRNHETLGKKQEFGSGRPAKDQLADLRKGQLRLQSLLGNELSPFFTPPWNRCSGHTLQGLQDLGFLAVSRSMGAKPVAPEGLPDLPINVDLHTRKEEIPEHSWQLLLQELEDGMRTGSTGIMIHHQRMSPTAYEFLAILFEVIASFPKISSLTFPGLL